jgi:hypothetical protein
MRGFTAKPQNQRPESGHHVTHSRVDAGFCGEAAKPKTKKRPHSGRFLVKGPAGSKPLP